MSLLTAVASIYRRRTRFPSATRPQKSVRRVAQRQVEQLEGRQLFSTILGTAETFAVLAGASVTNTGPTVLNGDLGVSPGSAISGFPPGQVTAPGTIHIADGVAVQAQSDALTAYNILAGLPTTQTLTDVDLGGLTLTSGVYTFATSAQLTGTVTLDAQNNPDAMFVFQMGSTLTTASAARVEVINASSCFDNVYWQVGSSATLGSTTTFFGAVVALTSITMVTGASIVQGNALALNGSVTLDDNTISPSQCGELSGEKFEDTNGDGLRQSGEPAVAGVTIFLDTNADDILNNGESSTVTASNGVYSFDEVEPGPYSVREVVPAGWRQTTPNPAIVTVPTRGDVDGGDFGNFRLGQVGGTTFDDVDGDGVQDAGEPGTSGVTVYIDSNGNGALDTGEGSTTSGPGGVYTLPGVGPGPVTVREVVPTGTTQSTPNPTPVTISSGGTVTDIDFGNTAVPPTVPPTGQLVGVKFQDTNGDGIRQAAEPGVADVLIFLDRDGDGTLDSFETCVQTDENGGYIFTSVPAGTYIVRETVPAGWIRTTTNPAAVTVASGSVQGGDFGNFELGRVTGVKFQDTNGDGFRNSTEPGLANFTIFLDANANGVKDAGERSTTTHTNGAFYFDDVKPGTFSVREVVPTGWTQTTANPLPVTMTSGATIGSVAIGNRLTPAAGATRRISGVKFQDNNGDGVRQTGENGVASLTLFLDTNNNSQQDTGEISTLTDAGGNYAFTSVAAGTYRVREVVPTGWVRTTANPGAVTVTSSTGTVSGGSFGNFKLGTISGVKFQDTNGNAVRDANEPVLSDFVIFIDANGDGILNSGERNAKSNVNGGFSFSNLGPGSYSLREVKLSGWNQTTPNPAAIAMTSGAALSVSFGNRPATNSQISGVKFHDFNGDGIRQTGDVGLGGVTMFLDRNNNGVKDVGELSTLTNATGGYAFTNVPVGTYKVREVLKEGWRRTTVNPNSVVVTSAGGTLSGGTFGNFLLGTILGRVNKKVCNCLSVAPPALGGVTIKLYRDVNGNGLIDSADGSAVRSTVSAADGKYVFAGMTGGKYLVKADTVAGNTTSGPTVYAVTVNSGSFVSGKNFLQVGTF